MWYISYLRQKKGIIKNGGHDDEDEKNQQETLFKQGNRFKFEWDEQPFGRGDKGVRPHLAAYLYDGSHL